MTLLQFAMLALVVGLPVAHWLDLEARRKEPCPACGHRHMPKPDPGGTVVKRGRFKAKSYSGTRYPTISYYSLVCRGTTTCPACKATRPLEWYSNQPPRA